MKVFTQTWTVYRSINAYHLAAALFAVLLLYGLFVNSDQLWLALLPTCYAGGVYEGRN